MGNVRVDIGSSLDLAPDDLENGLDAKKLIMCANIRQSLSDIGCKRSGYVGARTSVDGTVQEIIRAIAIKRGTDVAIKEVAISKGSDPSSSPIILASTIPAQETLSIMEYVGGTMTPDQVDELVPNKEQADILAKEIVKGNQIRDPEWVEEIAFMMSMVIPHRSVGFSDSGLAFTEIEHMNLPSIKAEIDRNGELTCWIYQYTVTEHIEVAPL